MLRRRRTTDLTDIIPDDTTNQSETYTVRLRKTPSFGSSGDESPSPDSPSPSSSPKPRNSPNLKLSLPDDKLPNNERKNDDVQLPEVKPKKKKKRLLIQGVQEVTSLTPPDSNSSNDGESPNEESADVAFIIQVSICFIYDKICCLKRLFCQFEIILGFYPIGRFYVYRLLHRPFVIVDVIR